MRWQRDGKPKAGVEVVASVEVVATVRIAQEIVYTGRSAEGSTLEEGGEIASKLNGLTLCRFFSRLRDSLGAFVAVVDSALHAHRSCADLQAPEGSQ